MNTLIKLLVLIPFSFILPLFLLKCNVLNEIVEIINIVKVGVYYPSRIHPLKKKLMRLFPYYMPFFNGC